MVKIKRLLQSEAGYRFCASRQGSAMDLKVPSTLHAPTPAPIYRFGWCTSELNPPAVERRLELNPPAKKNLIGATVSDYRTSTPHAAGARIHGMDGKDAGARQQRWTDD
jgi:hypothetical protein